MPEPDKFGPGRRLAGLRKALGLSQEELAERLETTQPTISDWEREKVPVSKGDLRLAADLCKDDRRVFAWLLGRGPMPEILSILTAGPSEAERVYTQAIFEIQSQARAVEGVMMVPSATVTLWLSRLHDLMAGG